MTDKIERFKFSADVAFDLGGEPLQPAFAEISCYFVDLAGHIEELREDFEARVGHLEIFNEKSTVAQRIEDLAKQVYAELREQREFDGRGLSRLSQKFGNLEKRIQALEAANSAPEGNPAEMMGQRIAYAKAQGVTGIDQAMKDLQRQGQDWDSDPRAEEFARQCEAAGAEQAAKWEAMADKLAKYFRRDSERFCSRHCPMPSGNPHQPGCEVRQEVIAEYEAMKSAGEGGGDE